MAGVRHGGTADPGGARPFASVVVRTRGDRAVNLREALTCLASQEDTSFEVVLVANGCDPGLPKDLVESFDPAFAGRVRLVATQPLGRSAALNAGLDAAAGEYLTSLDDDDVVTPDWIAAFHETADPAPGRVVRSGALVQRVRRDADGGYTTIGEPHPEFGSPEWDLVDHLVDNRSPIFSWAAPLDRVRAEGIRFDESLEVLEDWDFLMRCALSFGVAATGRVTGTYHRWESGEASLDEHGQEVWAATRQALHEAMEERLGAPGMIHRLARLYTLPAPDRDEIAALRSELERAAAR